MRIVGDIGERRLIEIIMKKMTPMPDILVPFWDDVSAVSIGGGKMAILKTDMLVWDTDVPKGMSSFQAARKAVVMNFSDLGSKGVRPQAFLASLAIPRSLGVRDVEEMARGFDVGAREYDAYVIGGDTNEASEVIISGMAYGVADEGTIMMRGGAQPRDILATTGNFGKTAAAFKILLEGHEVTRELRASLLDSVFMPKARVKEGVALANSGAVSASMDSSDGLAISLYDLSRSSEVGFRVDKLPTAPEAERFAEYCGLESSDLVLYGGEEYELVFTVKPRCTDLARAALRSVGCDFIEIGEVTTDRRIIHVIEGEERPIKMAGWNHFTR